MRNRTVQIEIGQWLGCKTPTPQKALELERPFRVGSNSCMMAMLSYPTVAGPVPPI